LTKKQAKARARRQRSHKVFTQEKMNYLLQKGKNRGFITTREVLGQFPELEKAFDKFKPVKFKITY